MKILLLSITLFFFNSLLSQDYFNDRLFIKATSFEKDLSKDSQVAKILNNYSFEYIKKAFKLKEMQDVYIVKFKKETYNLELIINELEKLSTIDYAEKIPIYRNFYTPNDPDLNLQWNLTKIQASQAWNLSQGCATIKVAVTDDGFLLGHEDLGLKWYVNPAEIPSNGLDDDGNGYIDDWRGWDAADNDNDPNAFNPTNSFWTHGTHVAGIIAAATNNSKGIASIGFNTLLIPVKNTNSSAYITHAYESVEYAIVSGADVINMSWGGGAYSVTYQTIFNTAYANGIICVAAAGNSNTSTPHYPAAYNHVISVASTTNTDLKSSFSNFGSTVDVSAPGSNIHSTLAGSFTSYGSLSGTSMAAPLVSGLCALMKCFNPMPIDSIEACLKRSTDNIDTLNPGYAGSLGTGRINAFKSLQCLFKKPLSNFGVSDTFQCIGVAVQYNATSIGSPTLTYNWTFPGGTPSTSTLKNPTVTYSTSGYKSATLITTNSYGSDTIIKNNIVNIDSPKAWLSGRNYKVYNSNPAIISINFKGKPPYNLTLTNGTNTVTLSNIKQNPYFYSYIPLKDTSIITISSFSDSNCVGKKYGKDTIYSIANFGQDTTITVILKTSDACAFDAHGSDYSNTFHFNYQSVLTKNWTINGNAYEWAGILKFNLNQIPKNATIVSAKLSLYADPSSPDATGGSNYSSVPNNSFNISRVLTKVNPSLTYTYPLSFTPVNQVYIPPSTSTIQDFTNIDVTNLVKDMFNIENNGFYIKHLTNAYFNSAIFCSAEHPNKAKVPKLEVVYKVPVGLNFIDTCEICTLNDGLVLNLEMNGNANDASGNNLNGIVSNATLATDRFGNPNGCYEFNGTSSYIEIPFSSKYQFKTTDSFTVSAWIRSIGSVPQFQSILVKAPVNSNIYAVPWNYGMYLDFNKPMAGYAYNHILNTPMVLTPNQNWHQMSFTYKNGIWHLYVDCQLVSYDSSQTKFILNDNTSKIVIGKIGMSNGWYFNGKIDDIKVYNRDLSASEMKGFCPCQSFKVNNCDTANLNVGLLAYYKLDGNTLDASGNNNHGTQMGGVSYVTGMKNQAASFDGVDDYIALNKKIFDSKTNFSISGWAYLNQNLTPSYQFNIYRENNHGWWGKGLDISYGYFGANQNDFHATWCHGTSSGMITQVALDTVPAFNWACFALTRKNDSLKLYIDGELRSTVYNQYLDSGNNNGILGGWYFNNDPNQSGFVKGYLDEIRMYDRELSPSEVIAVCDKCVSQINPLNDSIINSYAAVIAFDSCKNAFIVDSTTGFKQDDKVLVIQMKGASIDSSNSSNFGTIDNINNSGNYEFNEIKSIENNQILLKYVLQRNYNIPLGKVQLVTVPSGKFKEINKKLTCKAWDGNKGGIFVVDYSDSIKLNDNIDVSGKGFKRGIGQNNNLNSVTCNENNWYYPLSSISIAARKGESIAEISNSKILGKGKLATGGGGGLGHNSGGGGGGNYGSGGLGGYQWSGCSFLDNRGIGAQSLSMYYNQNKIFLGGGGGASQCDNGVFNSDGGNGGGIVIIHTPKLISNNHFIAANGNPGLEFNNTSVNAHEGMGGGGGGGTILLKVNNITSTLNLSTKGGNGGNVTPSTSYGSVGPGGGGGGGFISLSSNNPNVSTNVSGGINGVVIADGNTAYGSSAGTSGLVAFNYVPIISSTLFTNPCDTSVKCTNPIKVTYSKCASDTLTLNLRKGKNYNWTPNQNLSSNTIQNPVNSSKSSITYLVLYDDSSGCQIVDTVVVNVLKNKPYFPLPDTLICSGDSVKLTIPIFATNITWSPNIAISDIHSNSPWFYPTSTTTYYLSFLDTFGCKVFDTIIVSAKPCCVARARFDLAKETLCFGDLLSIINNSKNAITYNWDFGSATPNSSTSPNPPSISFTTPGEYNIRLIVSNNICFDTLIKKLNVIKLNAYAGQDSLENCLSIISVQLGENPISDWSYSWTPTIYLDNPNISNPICNLINDSVKYVLTIKDKVTGCSAKDTVNMYIKNIIKKVSQNIKICKGDSVLFYGKYIKNAGTYYSAIKKSGQNCDSILLEVNLSVDTPISVVLPTTYACESFKDSKGNIYKQDTVLTDSLKQTSAPFCDSLFIKYNVKIIKRKIVRTTLLGCEPLKYNGNSYLNSISGLDTLFTKYSTQSCDSLVNIVDLIVNPKPKASITADKPNPVRYRDTVTLTASGGTSYFWLTNGPYSPKVSHYMDRPDEITYTVKVSNSFGCLDTAEYKIVGYIPDTCYIGVPNVFSPNGDTKNDIFIPNLDYCADIISFKIFNRWGEKVFETNQLKGWDGNFKGKPAPLDVYIFTLEVKTPKGIIEKSGSFTLIR